MTDMSGEAARQKAPEALAKAHAQARRQAEAGDLSGARTVLEDALSAGELRLGRDHPSLAPLMVDLATIAREVGNLTEAQAQMRRAYGIVVTTTGPEHASALSLEARLATITHRLGEPTDAYDWHLVDAGARVLGSDHAAVRGAQHRLSGGPRTPPPPQPSAPIPTITGASPVPGESPPASPASSPVSLAPPGYARPTPANPADSPPASGEEGHGEPAYGEDGYAEPAYGEDGYAEPAYGEDGYAEPGYAPTYAPSPRAPGVYDRRPDADGVYVVPAPRPRQTIEVWVPEGPASLPGSRRARGGGVALVASLATAALVAGAVVAIQALTPRSAGQSPATAGAAATTAATPAAMTPSPTTPLSETPPTTPAPTVPPIIALAPSQVVLKDNGGSVTLSWRDPAGGAIPFIVAGGRLGTPPGPLETVPAGRTTSTIYGLSSRFNYCFTINAVYSTDVVASSMRTCTRRLSTGNAP